MQNTSSQILDRYIRARYPLIFIVSHEESRVMASIQSVAKEMKLSNNKKASRIVVEWSLTKGFNILTEGEQIEGMRDGKEYSDPNSAMGFIASFDQSGNHEPVLFVLKDLHRVMGQDLMTVRYLRDIFANFETRKHNVIMLSPELTIPNDIEKQDAVIDWALPGVPELEGILQQAEMELDPALIALNGNRDMVVQAMRGLTDGEAANALKAGIIASGKLDQSVVQFILNEKKQIIRKSGVLEYFEASVTMSDVGGFDNLKRYAAMKRNAMTAKAREAGVDAPKGVLLVGPPGTGKSLSAKAIAGGVYPLLRLDMGKLLGGGRVGEAENNIMSALKVAEAVAPCVLWMDEVEKALADNGGASDGGVVMRVTGSVLTWMQETTAPVYVVATANSINLRPELLSRFDDIMFVDLPDAKSREEILKVHLAKRNVKNFKDVQDVITATWGFSGREIEKVVKFAVERAFFDSKTVTVNHLLNAAQGIVPTSETKRDEIEALRKWASGKAIPAGRALEPKPAGVQTASNKLEL